MSTSFNVGFARLLKQAEDEALKNSGAITPKAVTPTVATNPQPVGASQKAAPASVPQQNKITPAKPNYLEGAITGVANLADRFIPAGGAMVNMGVSKVTNTIADNTIKNKTLATNPNASQEDIASNQKFVHDYTANKYGKSGVSLPTQLSWAKEDLSKFDNLDKDQKTGLGVVNGSFSEQDFKNRMINDPEFAKEQNYEMAKLQAGPDRAKTLGQVGGVANWANDNKGLLLGGGLGLAALLGMGGSGGQQGNTTINNYNGPGLPQQMRDDPYAVKNFNMI